MVKMFFLFIIMTANAFAIDSCENLIDLRMILEKRLGTNNEELTQLPQNNVVKIAVIDSGINISIKDLRSRIDYNKDLGIGFGYNFVDNSKLPFDADYGHGSNVAGIILAINPNAKIIPIKYWNKDASDAKNAENFEKAIEKAIELKVDIINISAGGSDPSNSELSILKKARDHGILIVAAAGNNGENLTGKNHFYPASYNLDNIISVMNNNDDGIKHPTSNFGSFIDISTIGTLVQSFSMGSNCNQRLTGTSQATPIISGIASLMLSFSKDISPSQIKSIIIKSANKSIKLKGLNKANGSLNVGKTLSATYHIFKQKTIRLSEN